MKLNIQNPAFLQAACAKSNLGEEYVVFHCTEQSQGMKITASGDVIVIAISDGKKEKRTISNPTGTIVYFNNDANTDVYLYGAITKLDNGFAGTYYGINIDGVNVDHAYSLENANLQNTKISSFSSSSKVLTSLALSDCYQLESVNLSGCTELSSLALQNSRKLSSVIASECTKLEFFQFGANSYERLALPNLVRMELPVTNTEQSTLLDESIGHTTLVGNNNNPVMVLRTNGYSIPIDVISDIEDIGFTIEYV